MNTSFKDTTREVAALTKMGLAALHEKYREAFGEETTSRNAAYLRKRIAFRVQELVEGGLTERALSRIKELGERAPLRERPPEAPSRAAQRPRDPRLPPTGHVLRKLHQGEAHEVTILDDGFLYKGAVFSTLSTVARKITGTIWNGHLFFGLAKRKRKEAA